MKKLIVDFDNTISVTYKGDYPNSKPVVELIEQLRKYKTEGFYIVKTEVIYRNMMIKKPILKV